MLFAVTSPNQKSYYISLRFASLYITSDTYLLRAFPLTFFKGKTLQPSTLETKVVS